MMKHVMMGAALMGLVSCGGASGNAQGLNGDYDGDLVADYNGTDKTYTGSSMTPSSTTTITQSSESRARLSIEAAYGDNDAVLYGLACVIPLKGASGELELADETSCTTRTETTSGTGTASTQVEETTWTFTELKISGDADKLKIDGVATYVTTTTQGSNKTGESNYEVEIEYEGKKVSNE